LSGDVLYNGVFDQIPSSAANLLYENIYQDPDSEKRPESDPKACDPVSSESGSETLIKRNPLLICVMIISIAAG
jgi:hypothetical protein